MRELSWHSATVSLVLMLCEKGTFLFYCRVSIRQRKLEGRAGTWPGSTVYKRTLSTARIHRFICSQRTQNPQPPTNMIAVSSKSFLLALLVLAVVCSMAAAQFGFGRGGFGRGYGGFGRGFGGGFGRGFGGYGRGLGGYGRGFYG